MKCPERDFSVNLRTLAALFPRVYELMQLLLLNSTFVDHDSFVIAARMHACIHAALAFSNDTRSKLLCRIEESRVP